ncbi:MAG: Rsd/AlgQ family anti-sigma factor [Gammaproteobacteria bacterium]|nr:Rsd/AlgQ family anti-sigma factor [Gammaproteobacteria bacterium]
MSDIENRVQERRQHSHRRIQELVGVRDQMLSLYSELAAQHPFREGDSVNTLLEQFCQMLIDYTADTHFGLYRYVDEKRERRRAVLEVADRIYPTILTTTDSILDFNDKYDFENNREGISLETLEQDLSRLGESLADRIELEDQLIQVLSKGRN